MKALAQVSLTGSLTAGARNLTANPVLGLLLRLSLPIWLGLLAVTCFNLWEVYLIARLGKNALAAYGFVAPWMMSVSQLAGGLGIGAATLVARSVGQNDWANARRYTVETFRLGVLLSGVLIVLGLWLMPPALQAMGATASVLTTASSFLGLWWLGLGTVILPMLAGAILRAMGDTYHASLVLLLSAGLNALLDPLLIWGTQGHGLPGLEIPAMGLSGVALASILSRGLSFGLGVWWIVKRRQLFCKHSLRCFEGSPALWRELITLSLPAALASLIIPVGFILITSVVARLGPTAVGAFGLVNRVESLALLALWSLTTALGPVVSQNIAAGHPLRARAAVTWSLRLCWALGLLLILLTTVGLPLGGHRLLSQVIPNPDTQSAVETYLRWAPWGYGALGMVFAISSAFSGIGRPVLALGLNLVRMLICYWPLALWLSPTLGWQGVVWSGLISYWVAGLLALRLYGVHFDPWAEQFHTTAQEVKQQGASSRMNPSTSQTAVLHLNEPDPLMG